MPQRSLTLRAPAKVNLAFEVLDKRSDGYHEVRTVLTAVGLEDTLTLAPASTLTLTVEPVGAAPVEGNLALRAAEALREATGCTQGAAMHLVKRIPTAGGLGGGSSDAAAALAGLRRLWGLGLDDEALAAIAARLGSDVPFFLRGGTALGTGRGDALSPLPAPVEGWAVIAAPAEGAPADKTANMYSLLRQRDFTDGAGTRALVARLRDRVPVDGGLMNAFGPVAERAFPAVQRLLAMLAQDGARQALVSGAGPCCFALCGEQAEAEALASRVRDAGYHGWAAPLLPAGEPGGPAEQGEEAE
jgi:4-diphosphocytidyl-2-C-methyl-D-erythritol kinase